MRPTIIQEKERWGEYLKSCNGMPNPIAKRNYEKRMRKMGAISPLTKKAFCINGRAMA